MPGTIRICLAFALLCFAAPSALADETGSLKLTGDAQRISMPTTPLADILDTVSKKTGKSFLVDHRVQPDVVVGRVRAKDITYPTLLIVLRNNELAAVSIGDVVNIVRVNTIRQFPLPVLFDADDTIADEEWVTRVIELENAPATQLIPILRPLLPKQGHLAAHPVSNMIIMVDRYANIRRVSSLIEKLDTVSQMQQ